MKYAILEAAVSCGSPFVGSEYAYDAIAPRLVQALGAESLSLYPMEKRAPGSGDPADLIALGTVLAVSEELRTNILTALDRKEFPVTVGGDHSVAMGTLAALSETVGAENLALIYIDAHTDINTQETSESHRIHGMDLAEALGLTDDRLRVGTQKRDILGPNIHFIGARSVDEPEWGILDMAGCHCHTREEIRRRGLAETTDEVIRAVRGKKTVISFDVDVLDPEAFFATGYNIPDGLSIDDVKYVLGRCFAECDVAAFECVEYLPRKDQDGRDLAALTDVLLSVLRRRS